MLYMLYIYIYVIYVIYIYIYMLYVYVYMFQRTDEENSIYLVLRVSCYQSSAK